MTAYRYYFSNINSANDPLRDGTYWSNGTGAVAQNMTGGGGAYPETSDSLSATVEVSGIRYQLHRFLAPVPRVGTLAGHARAVLIALQQVGGTARQGRLHARVRVLRADNTVRGTLLAGTFDTTFPVVGSYSNSGGSTRLIDGALTPVADVEATDRLLFEYGVDVLPGTSNNNIKVARFNGSLTVDHPFVSGIVHSSAPARTWFELDLSDPPGPPTGLAVEAAPTTLAVSWVAPTGTPATGYQYRVDGGAPVDVAGLSVTLAGLTPETSYTVEVRAVNASGWSAWVSITGTTRPIVAAKPWLVSEQLLARAGVDPVDGQPAFQWHDYAGGWATHDLRSRALMGWQITTGRANPRDKVAPAVVTVTVAAWGEYADAGLPELGHRFRLALAPSLTALGIPAGDLPRFTGEVTDVDLDTRTRVLTVTGVGRWARQSRQQLDGTGWPVEREGARITRILNLIEGSPERGTIDPGRVDLAPHAAAGTAAQLVDTVSDSTTGQLVERRDGALEWHDADHRRAAATALTLDAGELLAGFRWSQRVGDLSNQVRASYAGGEVFVEDSESWMQRGPYPASLDTLLTHPAAAQAIAGLIVGRYGRPAWLLPAVMLDLLRTLDPTELPAGVALAHGHKLQLTGLPTGGPYTERGVFVEGVTETLTPRAWRLTLTVADEQLSGAPIRWRDVPAGVRWTDARDGLRWLDVATIQDPAGLT